MLDNLNWEKGVPARGEGMGKLPLLFFFPCLFGDSRPRVAFDQSPEFSGRFSTSWALNPDNSRVTGHLREGSSSSVKKLLLRRY